MGDAARSGAHNYELVRRLAAGGMAELYLARIQGVEGFRKYVVLKRILPNHGSDEEFVKLFLDEARLAATLHHHNIAQVYDIGRIGSSYFFTMEYLHGQDLRALLKNTVAKGDAIPLPHVLTVVSRVASGLEYAHNKVGLDGKPLGIVHRDVSHSNVIVTYDGGVKLVDFGIATAARRTAVTVAGKIRGKVAYMSPEQCLGEPLDRRSDLFSLGILLYELSTGSRLFVHANDRNDLHIMQRIVKGEVTPPTSFAADYPRELERILLKTLARDRELRYQSANELLVDLEAFATDAKLSLSQNALAGYLGKLFGHPPEPWVEIEQAMAPRPTVTLSVTLDEDLPLDPEDSLFSLDPNALPPPSFQLDTGKARPATDDPFSAVPAEGLLSFDTVAWLLGQEPAGVSAEALEDSEAQRPTLRPPGPQDHAPLSLPKLVLLATTIGIAIGGLFFFATRLITGDSTEGNATTAVSSSLDAAVTPAASAPATVPSKPEVIPPAAVVHVHVDAGTTVVEVAKPERADDSRAKARDEKPRRRGGKESVKDQAKSLMDTKW